MPTIGPLIADSARLGIAYTERLVAGIPPDRFARLAYVGVVTIDSNHPAFILGHLSLYPSRVVSDLGGDASSITPSDDYVRLFSKDAKCVDDPHGNIYPPKDEVVERFLAAYQQAVETVANTEDAMFAVENPNEAMRAKFTSKGSMHAFYLGGHLMIHIGQFSAWRRAAGFGPA